MVLWQRFMGIVMLVAILNWVHHLVISFDFPDVWILTVVYNGQRIKTQRNLRSELSNISNLDFPWLITGDFNSIRSCDEYKGGFFTYYSRKTILFNDFITCNSSLEISSVGYVFTWYNG